MESKTKQILEALQMQPLSDEEKTSRHILGRLYGPIATTKEKTRNGRGYNKDLWEKALADDIFKEKLATKSLFLELGHPADREETDMKMVCACIPEMPKIVDGDLYAYVDILDTDNGRLLKTLCDYGFVPGISSRGSGDIMANDEVDPETFFLETWDIVQLPAVKKARLAMCESLEHGKTLKAALTESLQNATADGKKIMKETLDNLDIKLDEDVTKVIETDISLIPDVPSNIVVEGADEPVEETTVEEPVEEAEEVAEITEPALTVGAFIDELKDYDKDLALEWKPIVINDIEYPINGVVFDDAEEGKIVTSIDYTLPEVEDNISPEETVPTETAEVSSEEEAAPEENQEAAEEAGDTGDEEMIENFKEMVRQKDLLESEVRDLKNQKTVSDAKVNALNEELEKYKTGFMRVSELASKAGKLEKENSSLTEQLSQKDTEITDLKSKIENHTSLTESVNANEAKVKALTEKLAAVDAEAEKTEKELTEELEATRKKVSERTNVAKAYKAKYEKVLERYVASKATMLGVRPTDITSKLVEGYSLDDIDKVCDDLLNEGRPMFGLGYGASMKINESKEISSKRKAPIDPDNGYEIDDDLLILAGLK